MLSAIPLGFTLWHISISVWCAPKYIQAINIKYHHWGLQILENPWKKFHCQSLVVLEYDQNWMKPLKFLCKTFCCFLWQSMKSAGIQLSKVYESPGLRLYLCPVSLPLLRLLLNVKQWMYFREVSRHSSLKKIAGHLLLKGITFIAITPFYAASLVESVQVGVVNTI